MKIKSHSMKAFVSLLVILIFLLTLSYNSSGQDDLEEQVGPNTSIKYEYKIFRNVLVREKSGINIKAAEKFLNKYGDEGWVFENVIFDGTRLTNLSSQFLIGRRIK